MRLLWLFWRSRESERAAGGLLAVSAGAWAWGCWLGHEEDALKVALILFPLFGGTLLGVATSSPLAELERMASRSLVSLRATQVVGLLVIAATGQFAVTWAWPVLDAWKLATRNLTAFSGLSLLAAAVVGGRLAWVGPVGYGVGFFAVAGGGNDLVWALTAKPAGDDLAMVIAVSVLLCGVALICRYGARDPIGEAVCGQ